MLGLHKFNFIFIRRAYKNLFFLAFLVLTIVTQAQDYVQSETILPRTCEHEWVARYFHSVDENTSIEEMADFLIGLKSTLQAKGYQVPLLSDLCLQLREQLLEQNIPINDEIIDAIYNEFLKREASLTSTFLQFLASRSRGSALQIVYFFAKFIAKGAIYERRNKQFASDSLGDAAIKLYKVELTNSSYFRHANNADSQFDLLEIKHKKRRKVSKCPGGLLRVLFKH